MCDFAIDTSARRFEPVLSVASGSLPEFSAEATTAFVMVFSTDGDESYVTTNERVVCGAWEPCRSKASAVAVWLSLHAAPSIPTWLE